MRPPRRRQPAPAPAAEIPAWVARFDPADWPLSANGDEPRQPSLMRQRGAWDRQRQRWCEAHGLDVLTLIRRRQVESVYAHLRPAGRRPSP